MSPAVIALALSSAILHASWNAFLRSGADRLRTMTIMCLWMLVVAIPIAIWLPLPVAAAWPWLVLSSALQLGYSLFLVAAYRQGELGQVYPIVRGTAPLLVTTGGYVFLGQALPLLPLIGVILIASGIMSLALGRGRASKSSLAYAFTTGVFIASYATVDAIGVRSGGNPGAYATWIYIINGTMMVAAYLVIRRGLSFDLGDRETWKAFGGGMVSMAAYAAVISAYALGPAGPVTALRETSVVFAVLIGRLFLGETLSFRRLLACSVVAAGAICVGYPG